MTLYLDTEFNGHGGQLISLALVHTDGDEFYGVLPLPDQVHPWVAENVIPVLNLDPEPVARCRARLREFLVKYHGETIIADWPDDVAHLMQAMSGPDYASSFMVSCRMELVHSGALAPHTPHNALSDAWALRNWHIAPAPAAASTGLKPSMRLRWLNTVVPHTNRDGLNALRVDRVLQQAWHDDATGAVVWRAVPDENGVE